MNEAAAARIERACSRIVLRSIRAFDERDWAGFARLFAQDGVFVRANRPQEPLVGREAIRAGLAARPASRITRHFCTNIEIDVLDGSHARGRCYLLLYGGDASKPETAEGRPTDGMQRVGEYHDTFARVGREWLIARREGRLVFR